MEIQDLPEGYFKTFTQEWWESEDSKTGWEGSGWNEDEGFELVEYLEVDKYGNPLKALFKYEQAVFLGIQQAAWNILARFNSEYVNICIENTDKTIQEIGEINPRLKELRTVIGSIADQFKIKEYLKGSKDEL